MIDRSPLLPKSHPINVSCRLLTPYYFPFHLLSCFRGLSYAISLTLPVIELLYDCVINKFVNTECRSLVKILVSVRRHGAQTPAPIRVPEYSSVLSATQSSPRPSGILEMIMMMPADNP
jgi:hypothetical protein